MYKVVIGLEVHCELKSNSKNFSSSRNSYSTVPNSNVSVVDLGMPGILPVINKQGVRNSIKMALAMNCDVPEYLTFERKNYFYPDLPKGYQITQYDIPLCSDGFIDLPYVHLPENQRPGGENYIGTDFTGKSNDVDGKYKRIRIERIHLEEDVGKSLHLQGAHSYIDYNRCGTPLIEIVTQPDFRSAEEVVTYLNKLKSMFRSSGISECEEGAMRCDVNISVRPVGSTEFGVRTEIKNMASFEAIERAIKYESQRHMDALEYEIEELVQETRRFDDVSGKTFAMRNKETEADYRYFPDANLMPIIIDDEWMEQIKANKPVAVDEKSEEYRLAGISDKEIDMLISNHKISKLLDEVVAMGCNAKDAATWILTDCAGILRKDGKTLNDLAVTADKLYSITKMVDNGDINRNAFAP